MQYYSNKIAELKIKHTAAKEVGADDEAAQYQDSIEHYEQMQAQVK